jgi:transporter family protein
LLAGGGLLASFVGQMAFYQALKTGSLSQITPVAGAYPLVAALLGWIVLREPLTLTRVLGVLCVFAGVVLLRK